MTTLTVLLLLLAMRTLWEDVNRFLARLIGPGGNWVLVILAATALLALYHAALVFIHARRHASGKSPSPGMLQKLGAAAVFLVWGAMILVLFIQAGDAVLVAQVEYWGAAVGPWLLLSSGALAGLAALRAYRRAPGHTRVFYSYAIIGAALVLAAGALLAAGSPGEAPERGPIGTRDFNVRVLYDAASDPAYTTFRIPGIVATPGGTIITYCEARRGYSDWARMDICMRRSRDGGDTWEDMTPVAAGEGSMVNNPVMIAERASETVHFLYNTSYRRAWYRRSADAGAHWTQAVEITHVFEQLRSAYPWKVIAFGPGHGIHLRSGRLLAPVWLSPGGGGDGHHPQHPSTVYSDDGGRTWRAGEMVATLDDAGAGEPVAVELSDGRVMLNMRNEDFGMDRAYRSVSVSADGAAGWTRPALDAHLPDAVCFGALHRFDERTMLFSNIYCDLATDFRVKIFNMRGAREPLGIRASFDDGKTWPVSRIFQAHEAGYSDITSHGGIVYALFEQGWEQRNKYRTKCLKLARFTMNWIREGDGPPPAR